MAGALIVAGGRGTVDAVPAVRRTRDVVLVFQAIRTDAAGQPPFVNPTAQQFGTTITKPPSQGVWGTLQNGSPFMTTNGAMNPMIRLRPGEVQRWRRLAAGSGEIFPVALEGHAFHMIANDGITVPNMRTLAPGDSYVMGSGQRTDVLVQADAPGIYKLQALNPAAPAG